MTSIRARLLLSLLAALALAAALVGGITYRNVLHETEALFDYQLRQMALSLRDQGEIASGDAAALNDEGLDFVVQIWRIDGRSVYASRAHRALPSQAVLGLAEIRVDGERWRSFAVAARDKVIQVAQPVRIRQGLAADAALRGVLPLLLAAPAMAAALWWLITRSLRPLARVARQVAEQDAATLQPLPAADLPDEVAPLVSALNALLARLGQAWGQQRAFVADAAHELRSPLTALKLQAQVLRRLSEPAAAAAPPGNNADRAAALDALVAGVDRASRLVEQLLTLARSEPGAPAPTAQPVALAALLRQVLADHAAALAAARGSHVELLVDQTPVPPITGLGDSGITVLGDSGITGLGDSGITVLGDSGITVLGDSDITGLGDSGITVLGDPAALAVLVRNLVDNALRYTPAGGQVRLTLASNRTGPLLAVDDNGPGIPEAERERVFERFVRGAAAADAAGSGLGLAIVRSIAQRHGASVALGESALGGLRVAVQFGALANR